MLMLLPVTVKRKEAVKEAAQSTTVKSEKRPRLEDNNLFTKMTEKYPLKPLKPMISEAIAASRSAESEAATRQLAGQSGASQSGATATQLSRELAEHAAMQTRESKAAASRSNTAARLAQQLVEKAATRQPAEQSRAKPAVTNATQLSRQLTEQAATAAQLSQQLTEHAAAGQTATAAQLQQINKHLREMRKKLQCDIPTETQWTLLAASIELLSARQERMMSDLNIIKNHITGANLINIGDSDGITGANLDVSDESDDDALWGPVTPEDGEACRLGTPLCRCLEDSDHN